MKALFATDTGESEIELMEVEESATDFLDLDLADSDVNFEAAEISVAPKSKKRYRIISLNIPEFSMRTVKRCWKEGGLVRFTVCGKFDIPHRRNCKKEYFAEVTYPSNLGDDAIKNMDRCAKVAVVAAAAAFKGGTAGMAAAFSVSFKGCLLAAVSSKVSFSIKSEKDCGDWKPY